MCTCSTHEVDNSLAPWTYVHVYTRDEMIEYEHYHYIIL